jgi:BASS family bile acid:Na+ symporter
VGISVALTGLLPLTTGNFSSEFFFNVLYSLGTVIGLPLVLAQIARRFFPRILDHIAPLKNVSLVLWSLSLFIMAAIARDYYDKNAEGSLLMIGKMAVISLVICAANFFIGGLLSKRYKHESSQILGQKNTTFVVYLALEYASGAAALGTIFYVIYHNLWNSIQLFLHQKRSEE